MKRLVVVAVVTAVAVLALSVTCFYHSWATCYSTGVTKVLPDGGLATKYHCSCGDDMWVRE